MVEKLNIIYMYLKGFEFQKSKYYVGTSFIVSRRNFSLCNKNAGKRAILYILSYISFYIRKEGIYNDNCTFELKFV